MFHRIEGLEPRRMLASDIGRIANLAPTEGYSPNWLLGIKGGVMFAADDGIHGQELHFSDGTPGSTRMIKDIVPGSGGSAPRPLAQIGRLTYFFADQRLWRTDGTSDGTFPLTEPEALSSSDTMVGLTDDVDRASESRRRHTLFSGTRFVYWFATRSDTYLYSSGTGRTTGLATAPGRIVDMASTGTDLYFVTVDGKLYHTLGPSETTTQIALPVAATQLATLGTRLLVSGRPTGTTQGAAESRVYEVRSPQTAATLRTTAPYLVMQPSIIGGNVNLFVADRPDGRVQFKTITPRSILRAASLPDGMTFSELRLAAFSTPSGAMATGGNQTLWIEPDGTTTSLQSDDDPETHLVDAITPIGETTLLVLDRAAYGLQHRLRAFDRHTGTFRRDFSFDPKAAPAVSPSFDRVYFSAGDGATGSDLNSLSDGQNSPSVLTTRRPGSGSSSVGAFDAHAAHVVVVQPLGTSNLVHKLALNGSQAQVLTRLNRQSVYQVVTTSRTAFLWTSRTEQPVVRLDLRDGTESRLSNSLGKPIAMRRLGERLLMLVRRTNADGSSSGALMIGSPSGKAFTTLAENLPERGFEEAIDIDGALVYLSSGRLFITDGSPAGTRELTGALVIPAGNKGSNFTLHQGDNEVVVCGQSSRRSANPSAPPTRQRGHLWSVSPRGVVTSLLSSSDIVRPSKPVAPAGAGRIDFVSGSDALFSLDRTTGEVRRVLKLPNASDRLTLFGTVGDRSYYVINDKLHTFDGIRSRDSGTGIANTSQSRQTASALFFTKGSNILAFNGDGASRTFRGERPASFDRVDAVGDMLVLYASISDRNGHLYRIGALPRVQGSVFDDRDRDGVRDTAEPALAGIRVFIDRDNDGRWDRGEPFTRTAEDGSYTIDDLDVGSHRLRLTLFDGLTFGGESPRVIESAYGRRPSSRCRCGGPKLSCK